MIWNADNKWPERRKKAISDAEEIAMKHSAGRLPIPLTEVARECRVKNIFLRPLLIDGGIAVRADGFVIYVRSKGQKQDLFDYSIEDEYWATLSFRTYFTIAHEIAHTLFFHSTTPPKPKYEVEHPESIKSLEAACDLTASRILFPEPIRQYEQDRRDFLDPDYLRDLSNRTRLSARALVYRVAQPTKSPLPYGIICSLRHTTRGPLIEAVARHIGFAGIFPDLKEGVLLGTIVQSESFLLNGGDRSQIYQDSPAQARNKAVDKCIIRAERDSGVDYPNSFLTIRLAEPANR